MALVVTVALEGVSWSLLFAASGLASGSGCASDAASTRGESASEYIAFQSVLPARFLGGSAGVDNTDLLSFGDATKHLSYVTSTWLLAKSSDQSLEVKFAATGTSGERILVSDPAAGGFKESSDLNSDFITSSDLKTESFSVVGTAPLKDALIRSPDLVVTSNFEMSPACFAKNSINS